MPVPSLILSGPTASGKTALAVELALRHPFELVSADSMQVYRGLEIGTAQPTVAELRGLPIHCCGALDPREPFSVMRFIDLCAKAHADIESRGRIPLYVGGTGMYLRSLRWGIFGENEGPDADTSIRERLAEEAHATGLATLYARLCEVDPPLAAKVKPQDIVRIIRGLEVAEVTGRRLSELQEQWADPVARFPHRLVVLDPPREGLVERIERRVDEMLEGGWIEEVARLLAEGVPPDQHCFKALGYREIIAYLEGELDRAAMTERIKARTRQFSKRQMTWLRKEREVHWITAPPGDLSGPLDEIGRLLALN